MFGRGAPSKAGLQGRKSVSVNGSRFVIRKVNPLLDFAEHNMPQIFTEYLSRRKPAEKAPNERSLQRTMADLKAMLSAGLVEPALVPVGLGETKGNEPGITVEDLLRDEDTAMKLYWEIVIHSLNRFKGLRGVFFSASLRLRLWTTLANATVAAPATSPSAAAVA